MVEWPRIFPKNQGVIQKILEKLGLLLKNQDCLFNSRQMDTLTNGVPGHKKKISSVCWGFKLLEISKENLKIILGFFKIFGIFQNSWDFSRVVTSGAVPLLEISQNFL